MTAQVARLLHYPVKGLAGTELVEARLDVGGGFPHDRAVALSNGTAPLPRDGRWVGPDLLLGLARNPGLTRLAVRVGGGPGTPVTVTAPDGSSLCLRLGDPRRRDAELAAAEAAVRGWIPADTAVPPEVVVSASPLWTHPDAAVSIVNLATLALLAAAWRVPVDPARFRANVQLDGMAAGAELALVGRRLRLGTVELEVLRPIERGAAAAVDPADGDTGLDVPGLLADDVGHRFVGVYARVVTAGLVRRGDPVVVVDADPAGSAASLVPASPTLPPPAPSAPAGPSALLAPAGLPALPAPAGPRTPARSPLPAWPRPVAIEEVVEEAAGEPGAGHDGRDPVLSLWLRDPLGLAEGIRPGEHVRLHAADGAGPFWRSYTVSAVEAGRVRITVALEAGGRMSEHLRGRSAAGLGLTLTGPFGEPTVDVDDAAPLLLVSAGIGLTPTVALLRELVDRSSARPVSVLHVDRFGPPALWAEVGDLLDRLTGAREPVLHLTRESPARRRAMGARRGRPVAADLAGAVTGLPAGPVALVCGSAGFGLAIRAGLAAAGLAPPAIRQEVFYSPPPARRPRLEPADPGPFAVRFAGTGGDARWDPASGTLLDLAESCGLAPPVDCRVAACNVCATTVAAGGTAYTTPPMVRPPDGTVLICCAVPTSDVTLDL